MMRDQLRLIEDLLKRREIKKAEVVIARGLRSQPPPAERARLHIYRARTRLLSARPDDALADLKALHPSADDLPNDPPLLELWADCHLARFELATAGFADRGDTARAESIYRRVIAEAPDYDNIGWVYYQLGRVLLTQSHIDEAGGCFREALLQPSHISALTAYCFERLAFVSFYETRQPHRALGYCDKAIDTYPASAERRWLVGVHILRSRILRDMHRRSESLQAAEHALAIVPNNTSDNRTLLAETLLTVSELLTDIGGRDEAVVTYLQQFIQLSKKPLGVDVTWSRVYEMLGNAYFKTGQYDTAAAAYQSALAYNPYHPWETSLHYRIARSFYQHGDYERTIQSLYNMLAAARSEGETISDYRVYDFLGNALFAVKRYDEALEAYRLALKIAPANAENLDKIRAYHDYARELSQP